MFAFNATNGTRQARANRAQCRLHSRARGLQSVIHVEQTKAAELAALLDEQMREHRGVDAAAECERHARLRSRELEELRDGINTLRPGPPLPSDKG